MKIVVFSKNGCAPCVIVKNKLESQGVLDVEYTLEENAEEFEINEIKSTPTVFLLDDKQNTINSMSGFQPDVLDRMIAMRKEDK